MRPEGGNPESGPLGFPGTDVTLHRQNGGRRIGESLSYQDPSGIQSKEGCARRNVDDGFNGCRRGLGLMNDPEVVQIHGDQPSRPIGIRLCPRGFDDEIPFLGIQKRATDQFSIQIDHMYRGTVLHIDNWNAAGALFMEEDAVLSRYPYPVLP